VDLAEAAQPLPADLTRGVKTLDAAVVVVAHAGSRARVAPLFGAGWTVLLDEAATDPQQVAVALRAPWTAPEVLDGQTADRHYLFPSATDDHLFPGRDDVLAVQVTHPDLPRPVWLVVWQGVAAEPRLTAARRLLAALQGGFADRDYLLVAEIGGAADDRAVRVLESGDADAAPGPPLAGAEAMLRNLTRPLAATAQLLLPVRLDGWCQAEAVRVSSLPPLPRAVLLADLRPGGVAARLVNVNAADQAALEQLPGIGPVLAQRIITYRAAHGPFKSVDALAQVNGIGPKSLDKLRPFVTVE
jgi:competence ComEA-like helix-hairpin-helix protein